MSRFDDELRQAASRLAREPLPADILDKALDGSSPPPRRMLAAAATTAALLAVVAVGVGVGRLIPEPSPGPSDSALPSLTADPSPHAVRHEIEVNGVHMTAELDSDRGQDGEPVYLTVTVENRGAEPVYWSQSGCEWSTHVWVEPAPSFNWGRTWDGEAAELKQSLMYIWGYDDAPYNFGPAEREPMSSTGCFLSGAGRQELAPGAAVTDELAWLPEGPFGMPLPTQAYEVTASFPIIPATGDDPYDRDSSDNVRLTFEITVEGAGTGYLMPGEAVDVVLEDERLWAMLGGVQPIRWIVPSLAYSSEQWVISIPIGKETARMEPDFTIIARVDAPTGELTYLQSSESATQAPTLEPLSDSVEVDGVVRFTLSLDRDRTTPGQPIWAYLTIENLGSEELSWSTTGGCPLWPVARSEGPPVEEPYGRTDWTGDSGALKRVIVGDGPDLEHPFRPEEYIGVAAWSWNCDLMATTEMLGAGERRTYRSIWYGETGTGVPMPSGPYFVDADLAVFGVDEPLSVSVPLAVVGENDDWLAPGEAMDLFLEDATFKALLAEYPGNRWNSQDLVFEDERWKVRIYVSVTPTDWTHVGAVLGTLDARSGHIYGVRFDPDARPPGFTGEP